MNQRVFDMARQSGATDEKGSRAEHVFCFTKDELKGFAELIVKECADIAKHHVMNISTYSDADFVEKQIQEHFGVEE